MCSRWLWAVVAGALILGAVTASANTITVNSSADSGGTCPGATCTLRQAIVVAAPGDTIDFASGITAIDLTSAELLIDKNLTIDGASAGVTVQHSSVSGTPAFRIFHIAPGAFNVTFSALTIANGSSDTSGGGGILDESTETLTIASCTISTNKTNGLGGGVSNSNSGTAAITNSIISGNHAERIMTISSGGDGGGISNSTGGLVIITDTTITANQATGLNGGGGISNLGTMTVTNSTLSLNKGSIGSGGTIGAGSGAGIYNGGGTVTITNSTISGNVGARVGGGIAGGSATIINSTISDNRAASQGSGGGVHTDGTVNARNSIFANNLPADLVGTLTSQGYNLIRNTNGTTIVGVTTGNQLNVDPMLGPLQDNGGPTFTQALLNGSPARDKGDSSGSSTDQRGFTRPVDNPFIPNAAGGDASDIGAFEIQAGLTAKSLNISTRSRVQTGDKVMIAGFIITGNVPKQVILRGLGPSLVNAGVPAGTVLNDPVLELHGASGALITSNDNWKDSPQRAQIEGTAFQPSDDREAVILTTLPPASYAAVLKSVANSTGVGTVEVYDLDQSSDSMLTNISSRAFVETGDDIVIAGFTLGGSNNGSPLIIIRGLGPSLAAFGIANPLADPILQLRDANGTQLASNDNWKNDPAQEIQIVASGLQPQNDLEAAIAVALPPGAYTAFLFGVNLGTGVGTVEVYNLQ